VNTSINLDQWLKTVKSRICSKAFESYESLLAKYIRPWLGKTPIVAISHWTSKRFTKR